MSAVLLEVSKGCCSCHVVPLHPMQRWSRVSRCRYRCRCTHDDEKVKQWTSCSSLPSGLRIKKAHEELVECLGIQLPVEWKLVLKEGSPHYAAPQEAQRARFNRLVHPSHRPLCTLPCTLKSTECLSPARSAQARRGRARLDSRPLRKGRQGALQSSYLAVSKGLCWRALPRVVADPYCASSKLQASRATAAKPS